MATVLTERHLIDHPSENLSQSLSTAVEGALWRFDPIRQTNTSIEISDQDGVVTLQGNIRSAMMKSVATRIAAGVPGVRQVVNQLRSDPEIIADIALKLAMDPEVEITTDKVSVESYSGNVVLSGRVFNESQEAADALRDRLEALAREIEGVVDVRNDVDAIEGDESAFVVQADVVEVDDGATKATGPKKGGNLIPDAMKDKLRAMIKARAEARAAAG